jgi:hypothetical protein
MPTNLDDIFNSYKKKDDKKTIEVISKNEEPTKISKDELITKTNPSEKVQSPIIISPQPAPSPSPISSIIKPIPSNGDFDFSPEKPEAKHGVAIYGRKGEGKTSLSMSFPGIHVCFSFDKKSVLISENPENISRVTVYDGFRYMDKSSPQAWLDSSEKTWKYLNALFKEITVKPDWVIVDGGEYFETTAEMVMRGRNGLMPFQGVANRSVWKERRMYLDQFYTMCMHLSKKGVIWTSYIDKDEIVQDGTLKTKVDVPKWVDVVLTFTDTLIKVDRETDKSGQKFFATIESSKWKVLPHGARTEITGRGILALAKGEL